MRKTLSAPIKTNTTINIEYINLNDDYFSIRVDETININTFSLLFIRKYKTDQIHIHFDNDIYNNRSSPLAITSSQNLANLLCQEFRNHQLVCNVQRVMTGNHLFTSFFLLSIVLFSRQKLTLEYTINEEARFRSVIYIYISRNTNSIYG